MKTAATRCATYRLQFNRDFSFADASRIMPYLHLLGISHVYASPFVKARTGSPHGYDIVDHNALNPEIGDQDSFAAYVQSLRQHGMAQILDIVPNHMGVGGDDNNWWLEVLENGEASFYSGYFDIDWHPANSALHNKILLPFLGDHYGSILEQGELELRLDAGSGSLAVHYYQHLFPVDVRTYPQLLNFRPDVLQQIISDDQQVFDGFTAIIAHCRLLPRRTELSAARRQNRQQGSAACKRGLAALCRRQPALQAFLEDNIKIFNSTPDLLHGLLEKQAYRLAYWQVASDEINYRRFFDINELAGLRMENSEVFAATHRLVRQLIRDAEVDGLRIDHPDGLSDPYAYCCNLQKMIGEITGAVSHSSEKTYYLLLEKILASHEDLPEHWPVAGTTGYETAYLLNGLFIYADSERPLSQLYSRFSGRSADFDEQLYQSKKLIMNSALASELSVLANLASNIAQADRYTRDFTRLGLRAAIAEVVACFPVYRTYISRQHSNEQDLRYIHQAIMQAKKRSPAADIQIFDFIQQLLSLSQLEHYSSRVQRQRLQFALRFQQYSAPVMAKGMEDTAFYRYNRLLSLNDVGFEPRIFAISVNAFHQHNQQRLARWPQSMVTTSTHDSKRGEDVRSRINVLSELPDEWRRHLARWSRINRGKKRLLQEVPAPARNDEYLLYQTLLGSWPLQPPFIADDTSEFSAYRERIVAYMLKAIREAKLHTSWINPNSEYETAMSDFITAILQNPASNAFLADFIPFQQRMLCYGLLNSLSQTLLKLTVPGIPDIYQGSEIWSFNLVDPDNRRPVDYALRRAQLQTLIAACESRGNRIELLQALLARIEDGDAKLFLIWQTLKLRRQYAEVFSAGEYLPLQVRGPQSEHLCVFARRLGDKEIIVVATRWFARLAAISGDHYSASRFTGTAVWQNNWIEAAAGSVSTDYRNIISDETVHFQKTAGTAACNAAHVLRHFPLALLINEP